MKYTESRRTKRPLSAFGFLTRFFLDDLKRFLLELIREKLPLLALFIICLPHREVACLRASRDGGIEPDLEPHAVGMVLSGVDHPLYEISLYTAIERLVVILMWAPQDVEARLPLAFEFWVF